MFSFTCNICETRCTAESTDPFHLQRESPSCTGCGSTVRFRWIVHALSVELFGQSLALPKFPKLRGVRGIGMSEWSTISDRLTKRLCYTNTFFHTEPRFDILHPKQDDEQAYDFVICSEVFEHVPPPIQIAFDNLARILRPDGFVVFSVPWVPEGATQEHFPELFDWDVAKLRSGSLLVNRTISGEVQIRDNLIFHGGEGQTLEMRVFSQAGLVANLSEAGFRRVEFAGEYLPFGIVWVPWSKGLIAGKMNRRR